MCVVRLEVPPNSLPHSYFFPYFIHIHVFPSNFNFNFSVVVTETLTAETPAEKEIAAEMMTGAVEETVTDAKQLLHP